MERAGDQTGQATRRALTGDDADPDQPLVLGVARGDPAAARALLARKLPRLLALARRMLSDPVEAEDVAQEVMLRVWRAARPNPAGDACWRSMALISSSVCSGVSARPGCIGETGGCANLPARIASAIDAMPPTFTMRFSLGAKGYWNPRALAMVGAA